MEPDPDTAGGTLRTLFKCRNPRLTGDGAHRGYEHWHIEVWQLKCPVGHEFWVLSHLDHIEFHEQLGDKGQQIQGARLDPVRCGKNLGKAREIASRRAAIVVNDFDASRYCTQEDFPLNKS